MDNGTCRNRPQTQERRSHMKILNSDKFFSSNNIGQSNILVLQERKLKIINNRHDNLRILEIVEVPHLVPVVNNPASPVYYGPLE